MSTSVFLTCEHISLLPFDTQCLTRLGVEKTLGANRNRFAPSVSSTFIFMYFYFCTIVMWLIHIYIFLPVSLRVARDSFFPELTLATTIMFAIAEAGMCMSHLSRTLSLSTCFTNSRWRLPLCLQLLRLVCLCHICHELYLYLHVSRTLWGWFVYITYATNHII